MYVLRNGFNSATPLFVLSRYISYSLYRVKISRYITAPRGYIFQSDQSLATMYRNLYDIFAPM